MFLRSQLMSGAAAVVYDVLPPLYSVEQMVAVGAKAEKEQIHLVHINGVNYFSAWQIVILFQSSSQD